MKKNILLFPVLVWLSLFIIEAASYFFLQPKPMYFRAWEYVLNQGKDSYYIPFQPRSYYNGTMTGDLLFMTNFLPKKSEIRPEIFQADEYGFRNKIGTFKSGVEVVMLGTSFVGGAQETQSKLVSSILTDKYGIKTYNYATLPLQLFWEDSRFIKKPPKYVVIIANETEALQNTWTEYIEPSKNVRQIPPYSSHEEWVNKQGIFDTSYNGITTLLKRFSIVKFELRQIYLHVLNFLFPRNILGLKLTALNIYDLDLDMLFWDSNSYNPLLNKKAVDDTIITLKKTRDILKTRNITTILVVVPSKTTLYSKTYRSVDPKKESLYALENEMERNGIEHLKLLTLMRNYKGGLLYYKDDGHWSYLTNEIIAKELSSKIHEIEEREYEKK